METEGWVAIENKNNIVNESDCSNCEAAYFGESKRSLKYLRKHKRWFRSCDFEKNEIAKDCWEADYNFSWDHSKAGSLEDQRNYTLLEES